MTATPFPILPTSSAIESFNFSIVVFSVLRVFLARQYTVRAETPMLIILSKLLSSQEDTPKFMISQATSYPLVWFFDGMGWPDGSGFFVAVHYSGNG